MSKHLNIYTIYTSKDKAAFQPVLDHLKTLEQDQNLNISHSNPILDSQQWKPHSESFLQETDIFLLFLSSSFMYSEFVKQLEFKMLIDSYKASESTVIPILLEDCPWDTEFLSEDYKFSFNELHVLPEQRKPIKKWDSDVSAYNDIAASINKIIVEKTDIPIQQEVQKVEETLPKTTKTEDQIAISFDEEKAEEQKALKEIEKERKAEEERRLWRASEAKRQAAQNQKRKAEEQRLKEAAEAKRIVEAQHLDEAELEVEKVTQDEKSLAQQDDARRIVEDEKQLAREIEADRIAQEQRRAVEEKETNRVQAVAAAKQKEQERNQKLVEKANKKVEEQPQREETSGINKKIHIGSIIAILAILAIWAFSGDNEDLKKPIPVVNTTPEKVIPKVSPAEEIKIDAVPKAASVPKLAIGDQFEGGVIFSIDSLNNSGKIAHIDDVGPMPWQSANNIHEQLGEGWRLPTLKELQLMRKTLGQGTSNSAEFSDGLYWSATAFDEHQARLLRFRDGNTSYHYNRNIDTRKYRVRAVKDFSR